MKRTLLLAGLLTLLFAPLSRSASALVIDSGPMAWETSYAAFFGPSVAGGTFTAIDIKLHSFSLFLGVSDGTQSNSLRAVVLATDGAGVPTGAPLWESPDFEAVGPRIEYLFLPSLDLTIGAQYFIGVDSGLLTTVSGGDFTIQASAPADAIPGGMFWDNVLGGGFLAASGSDIRTTITLVNPEPTTGALLVLGLGILGWTRRAPRSRPH